MMCLIPNQCDSLQSNANIYISKKPTQRLTPNIMHNFPRPHAIIAEPLLD